jgi:MtfA peptidase
MILNDLINKYTQSLPMENIISQISFNAVLIVIVVLLMLFRIVGLSNDPFVKRTIGRLLPARKLNPVYLPYLSRNFPFYNRLSDKEKLIFERRVQKFIDLKTFIPRGGIREITPEMKALIAGSAIQLTFGYPSIYFRHFWRILIYPDNYYSTITRQYHKGEVNRGGLIVVSWKSLKEGFQCHGDGYHLGLHEMAHALRLINIVDNEEYNFYDRQIMAEFDAEAQEEILRMSNPIRGESLFRSYAATNVDEFFAVAVELFFEKPNELKEYSPKIFNLLTQILKIDPSR